MGVTVRRSGLRLKTTGLVTAALMREVGDLAIERIIRRTQAGKDEDGAAFAPYSPGYRIAKAKYQGTAGTTVDLTRTGSMLNSMQVTTATDSKAVIAFVTARAAAKALYHDKTGAGRSRVIRRFFGLNDSDKAAIDKRVSDHLRRVLRSSW